jgi:hypothetical protein
MGACRFIALIRSSGVKATSSLVLRFPRVEFTAVDGPPLLVNDIEDITGTFGPVDNAALTPVEEEDAAGNADVVPVVVEAW